MSFLSYLFAIAAGAANPAQAGANAELNKDLASPVWSGVLVYFTGLAGILILQLILREAWPAGRWSHNLQWWALTGGLLSIASTMAGLTLAHKMGSGTFTGLSLTASLISSILLDQFGWMGFKPHPAHSMRLLGAGFMLAGIWLIAKF